MLKLFDQLDILACEGYVSQIIATYLIPFFKIHKFQK